MNTATNYPQPLGRNKYHDEKTGKTFNFLTNNFAIPAQTVADLYRYRRQVELFYKWIKQHLRIKSFFGTTKNAVKSRIWIAIIKKRHNLSTDLYTTLQIMSLTLFEKVTLEQMLANPDYNSEECDMELGGRRRLLTCGSYRSGRAQLGHPAPQTMESLHGDKH